jgi:hypothetical protein
MANMAAKHGNAKDQCSCCDKGGRVRRSGKRGAKAREKKAWQREAR